MILIILNNVVKISGKLGWHCKRCYAVRPKKLDAFVKLLISAYFTGELTQRDPQEVREEGP